MNGEVFRSVLEGAGVGVAILDADGRYLYANQRLATLNGVAVADHVGRTIDEVIPHLAHAVRALHAEVLRSRRPRLDVQLRGSTPGAPDRIWQAHYLPLVVDGADAVGVAITDVTERERALELSRRRERQHSAVAELSAHALTGKSIAELTTSARSALRCGLGAEGGRFDADDADFVRALANVLGTAELRQTHAVRRRDAVVRSLVGEERERGRLADVLHDDVLQHLLFARQELESAGQADGVARARASLDEATGLLRTVVAALHPVTLAHAGLEAALERLAAEIYARSALAIDIRVAPGATGSHDRLVLSIARELLGHVAEHDGAAQAVVSLAIDAGRLRLRIADDGCEAPDLLMIRERVEAVGGQTRVTTGLGGRGTSVEVELPTDDQPIGGSQVRHRAPILTI